jgi:hypothetical protein
LEYTQFELYLVERDSLIEFSGNFYPHLSMLLAGVWLLPVLGRRDPGPELQKLSHQSFGEQTKGRKPGTLRIYMQLIRILAAEQNIGIPESPPQRLSKGSHLHQNSGEQIE